MLSRIDTKPVARAIINTQKVWGLATGPIAAFMDEMLKEQHIEFSIKGKNNSERYQSYAEKVDRCGSRAIALCFDGSGWDGSLTKEFLIATEGVMFKRLMPQIYNEWLRTLTTVGKTTDGSLRFQFSGCRRSGDTYTSCSNTIINAALQCYALHALLGIHPDYTIKQCMIEGDDAIILLSSDSLTATFTRDYQDLLFNLGIDAKFDLCRPYMEKRGLHSSLPPGSFCSQYYSVTGKTAVPKIARTLRRMMYSTKVHTHRYDAIRRTMGLSLLHMARDVALLSHLAQLLIYDTEITGKDWRHTSLMDRDTIRRFGLSNAFQLMDILNEVEKTPMPDTFRVSCEIIAECYAISLDTVFAIRQDILSLFDVDSTNECHALHLFVSTHDI